MARKRDNDQDAAGKDPVAAVPRFTWERITRTKVQVKATYDGKMFYSHAFSIHSATARTNFAKGVIQRGEDQFGVAFEASVIEEELMGLAEEVDKKGLEEGEGASRYGVYAPDDPQRSGIYRHTTEGETPLTNFDAAIVREIVEDDGVEQRLHYEIEARVAGRTTRFTVPATQFASMNWVTENLGAKGVVYAGQSVKDHARAAIQVLSTDVTREVQHAHLGWIEHGGKMVYLYGGGAIGKDGLVKSVRVSLGPPFDLFVFPKPPIGKRLVKAVKTALNFLKVAPDIVSMAAFAAIWRAVLGGTDFSLFFAGQSGEGKTELAALMQQFWGPGLDARHLPTSWETTANANAMLASIAKDAALVVDDFAPAGGLGDVQKAHRDADKLMRGQGNSSGRARLSRLSTLMAQRRPRCLIIATGEDLPRGVSLRARIFMLEVSHGAVNWGVLTDLQRDAREGRFAAALAGYIRWLAPQYQEIRDGLPKLIADYRSDATESADHRRTPDIVANLAVGLHYFTDFAVAVGAMTEAEANKLFERGWKALGAAAAAQRGLQQDSDPVRRFLELLAAALASGKAHIATTEGRVPPSACRWGWRDRDREIAPMGDRIGWVEDDELYLEPEAAYAVAQRMAQDGGEPITIGPKTLHKRLRDQRKLISVDTKRQRLTVRRWLEGRQREVLRLRATVLGALSEGDS